MFKKLKRLFDSLLAREDISNGAGAIGLRRWRLFKVRDRKVYLHHFLDDEARDFHDHPFWFLTFILWNGYIEETLRDYEGCGHYPGGKRVVREMLHAPSIHYRRPEHTHRIRLKNGKPAWTLVITGPKIRDWGFWSRTALSVKGGWGWEWTPWRRYLGLSG